MILNPDIETKIQHRIIANVLQSKYALAIKHVADGLELLYDSIPQNKLCLLEESTKKSELYAMRPLNTIILPFTDA